MTKADLSALHPQLSLKSLNRHSLLTLIEILLENHAMPTSVTSAITLWPLLLSQMKIQEGNPEFNTEGFLGHSLRKLPGFHTFLYKEEMNFYPSQ